MRMFNPARGMFDGERDKLTGSSMLWIAYLVQVTAAVRYVVVQPPVGVIVRAHGFFGNSTACCAILSGERLVALERS